MGSGIASRVVVTAAASRAVGRVGRCATGIAAWGGRHA